MPKFLDRVLLRVIPLLGYGLIRLLQGSMRIQTVGSDRVGRFWKDGRNVIVAFWHGRQLMLPVAYRGKGVSIMVSRHRDGEWIARTVAHFGFRSVRGSTTRGGASALRSLIREARSGRDVGITPDGPRGPRHRVRPGVVELARQTGLPILPLAFGASKKKF